MWRVRPQPRPGEALTSWLARVAETRGKLPFQLIQELVPGLQFWNRDGDLHDGEPLIAALSQRIGVAPEKVRSCTLRSFAGVLDDRIDGVRQSFQVRPVGVYHRTRRAHGQQYCPLCLADGPAYYRVTWRLTLFPTCTTHGVVLLDECPSCAAPVVPHRAGLVRCHECRADLRDAAVSNASPSVLQLQRHGERVLFGATVTRPGMGGMHPLVFFAVQLHLLSRVVSAGRAGRLRRQVAGTDDAPEPDFRGAAYHPRHLTSASAHDQLVLLERLMRGWPMSLVGHCLEADVFWSWLLGDERTRPVPFELREVCATYLAPGSAPRDTARNRSTAVAGGDCVRAAHRRGSRDAHERGSGSPIRASRPCSRRPARSRAGPHPSPCPTAG